MTLYKNTIKQIHIGKLYSYLLLKNTHPPFSVGYTNKLYKNVKSVKSKIKALF